MKHQHTLDAVLHSLNELNVLACRVVTRTEFFTAERMNEPKLAELVDRVGTLGSNLPNPVRELVDGCGTNDDCVTYWGVELLKTPFNPSRTVARHDGLRIANEAILQHEAATNLVAAIDQARDALTDMLPV